VTIATLTLDGEPRTPQRSRMLELRPLEAPPIRDFPGLHEALRRRQAELAVSLDTVAAVSGLSWAGKVLQPLAGFGDIDPGTGRCAGRNLGLTSLGPMLGCLGLVLVPFEDVRATARLRARSDWVARAERNVTSKGGITLHELVDQRALQLIAERGAELAAGLSYRG
jgi:hypothetical protein